MLGFRVACLLGWLVGWLLAWLVAGLLCFGCLSLSGSGHRGPTTVSARPGGWTRSPVAETRNRRKQQ